MIIVPGQSPSHQKETEDQKAITYWIDEIQMNMRERDFQRDFFESLCDQFYKKGTLSFAQIASLKKIYERVTG